MTPEQQQQVLKILERGEQLSPDWKNILFPPQKREYELVYEGKEREEDVIADTLGVPLQAIRAFNQSTADWQNKLIFGDNLQAMKTLLADKRAGRLKNADGTDGVKLVYIDPPFATNKDFTGSAEQKAYQDRVLGAQFIEFIRKRLIILRELLAEDGSIFVHLDWKKGHYIRVVMDEVFGEQNFLNEVIWHYRKWSTDIKAFQRNHDSIFWYVKRGGNKNRHFEVVAYEPPSEGTMKRWKGKKQLAVFSESGVRTASETSEVSKGAPISDVWKDIELEEGMLGISIINPAAVERTGYPTQKPEALLDRIIRATTKPGDIVLDAFAGSGTSCAVAEKLERRWIAIDCGKLAIYSIQKRMLTLRSKIGNKGDKYTAKPFTLYNAGLYDFARLKELSWDSWRAFCLMLFQCQDRPHTVGGVKFDGMLKGASVLVFDHKVASEVRISEETISSLHDAVGSKIGTRAYIIAPALSFDFQQDYLDFDGTRYYALRIPYSIIHELHRRDFTALRQPVDALAVNDTVDSVGFDFINTPEIEFDAGVGRQAGELLESAFIRIKRFESASALELNGAIAKEENTLSMVLLDFDFDSQTDLFNLCEVFYAGEIVESEWTIRFQPNSIGRAVMAVFVDIFGNEARVVIPRESFFPKKIAVKRSPNKAQKPGVTKGKYKSGVA